MSGKIIKLGNSEEEFQQNKEKFFKKQRQIRKKLLNNGWSPQHDENGKATGKWNNIMISPFLILTTRAAFRKVVADENILRNHNWRPFYKTTLTTHDGWYNPDWQISERVPIWEAIEITKNRMNEINTDNKSGKGSK